MPSKPCQLMGSEWLCPNHSYLKAFTKIVGAWDINEWAWRGTLVHKSKVESNKRRLLIWWLSYIFNLLPSRIIQKKLSVRDCLNQVSQWACLWNIILLKLQEVKDSPCLWVPLLPGFACNLPKCREGHK